MAPRSDDVEPLIEINGEIGVPRWVFGVSRYALLDDGRVVFAYCVGGIDRLAIRLPDGTIEDLAVPFSMVRAVRAAGGSAVVVIAASAIVEASVTRLELGEGSESRRRTRCGRRAHSRSSASARS